MRVFADISKEALPRRIIWVNIESLVFIKRTINIIINCAEKFTKQDVVKKKIRIYFNMGSSIKDVRTNLGIFGTPLPLSRPVHIWLSTHYPSPCPCGHKAGITWNIATCEQFTLKGKKNWSLCLKITWKTFEWRQYSKWCHYIVFHTFSIEYKQKEKFYIQTYCQIIRVNFTNTVAIIFFPCGCPHLANHLLPLSAFVHFCLTPLPSLMCGHPLWMAPIKVTLTKWIQSILKTIFEFMLTQFMISF